MRKDYDIVGSYDNQRISNIDCERTVNMFEFIDPNGKRPKTLIYTSGLELVNLPFEPETGGSRASFLFQDVFYQVFGATVYRIGGNTGSLTVAPIGTLASSVGYVGVEANTFQVIFVDGTLKGGWIWDTIANTFTKISDASFPDKPIDVTYLDGFFVVANGETNNFQLSMFNQGMVWGPAANNFTVPSNDVIDVGASTLTGGVAGSQNYRTGVPVTVSSTVTLPTGLAANTTYYAITLFTSPGVIDLVNIKLASSLANAQAGTAISITSGTGSGTFTITSLGQLQQGSITSHPGNIVACRTLHRRLFLFSRFFTEVWENSGIGSNLPFRRNNNLLMEVGTPAIGSITVNFDQMYFLSQDRDGIGTVVQVTGTEAVPIGNRALDYQLAQYAANSVPLGISHISDCRGIGIKENGIIFYRMNFTIANHTFVLNVSMSTPDMPRWHEEEVLNGNRHPAQTHVFYKGVNYYGDYSTAKLYRVDPTLTTNNLESIRRMRIGKPVTPEGYNRLRIDRFHLDLVQGVVDKEVLEEAFLLTEAGDDLLTEKGLTILLEQQVIVDTGQPVVFFSYSKDGGISYGNIVQGTMGKIGERTYRTVWRKLGVVPRGQGFVPKFEFYNQVPFTILGAAWDFEVLPE